MTSDKTTEDPLLSSYEEDGSLYNLGWYLQWTVGQKTACLDGDFTVRDLRAIADHMEKHNAE